MAKRLALLMALSMMVACRREATPVVVHVFRDRNGAIGQSLDTSIQKVSRQSLTMPDGTPVVIATLEFKNYDDSLAAIGTKHHPDLVIVNSRADLPTGNFGGSPTDLDCAPSVKCAAVIPSWTGDKTRIASERVLELIKRNLPGS